MARVEVDHLSKRFGALSAVDDLSFALPEGSVTGFLGRNGAGKTTTLRMLLGLVVPSAGVATIDGARYAELRHPVRTVGALLEASNAHPSRSAVDHLRTVATAAGVDRRRVPEVLALVGLADDAGRRVGGFSLGMRQRLGLATAMLGDPSVLVLDEPTNGLDPAGVHWLRSLLRRLGDEGRTVLVSSHLLSEVAQTVDRVVIVGRGRLVADCPLDALAARSRAGVRVRSDDPARLAVALAVAGIATQQDADAVVALDAAPDAVGRVVAAAGLVVYEMSCTGDSLEDVFLRLTAAAEGGTR